MFFSPKGIQPKEMVCVSHVLAFGCALLVFIASHHANALSCVEALNDMAPCEGFLLGSGPNEPDAACCSGARTVFNSATTAPDRRDLCSCLQNAARQFPVDPERAKELPTSCNFKSSVPIDPNVDCSKII